VIVLGDTVRDTVTGFEGTATARTDHLGGRTELCIERPDCESGMPELAWFDVNRVELVARAKRPPVVGFEPPNA
jgi:hypothetical protein